MNDLKPKDGSIDIPITKVIKKISGKTCIHTCQVSHFLRESNVSRHQITLSHPHYSHANTKIDELKNSVKILIKLPKQNWFAQYRNSD
jgi:hypothetical protein